MSSSKIVKRLILIAIWIIFYFMLIDVTSSLVPGGILLAPIFYYMFADVAVVCGPVTDYILRTYFNWYTTRFLYVLVGLIWASIVFGCLIYVGLLEMVF